MIPQPQSPPSASPQPKPPRIPDPLEPYILGILSLWAILCFVVTVFSASEHTIGIGWCCWVGCASVLPWRYVFTGEHSLWAAFLAVIGSLLVLDVLCIEAYYLYLHLHQL